VVEPPAGPPVIEGKLAANRRAPFRGGARESSRAVVRASSNPLRADVRLMKLATAAAASRDPARGGRPGSGGRSALPTSGPRRTPFLVTIKRAASVGPRRRIVWAPASSPGWSPWAAGCTTVTWRAPEAWCPVPRCGSATGTSCGRHRMP
jgi:hypothetical protein